MLMAENNGVCEPTSPEVVDALTDALQAAMEAAVLPNQFEIDEQEPSSRLEALTEQLLNSDVPERREPLEVEATHLSRFIILGVVRRIRAKIGRLTASHTGKTQQ
jgi:hypothetical protein